jgi:hypothetical protein
MRYHENKFDRTLCIMYQQTFCSTDNEMASEAYPDECHNLTDIEKYLS